MAILLACLSSGKGTWTEVVKIINSRKWNKVFLVTDNFGKENFQPNSGTELIVVNFSQETAEVKEDIKKALGDKINYFEIALNFVSGNGKEHMAILETVLELGLNFRLVTLNNGEVTVMGMER